MCLTRVYIPCWKGQGEREARESEVFEGDLFHFHVTHRPVKLVTHAKPQGSCFCFQRTGPLAARLLIHSSWLFCQARAVPVGIREAPGPGSLRPPTLACIPNMTSFLRAEITSSKHRMEETFDKEIHEHFLEQALWLQNPQAKDTCGAPS